jgi:aerobic-type carbon monoxide dehydrogenase small subunit (CoxS/CutS family)
MQFFLNGSEYTIEPPAGASLKQLILGIVGAEYVAWGCQSVECRYSCSVLLDGHSVRACQIPADTINGKHVVSLCLGKRAQSTHPLLMALSMAPFRERP